MSENEQIRLWLERYKEDVVKKTNSLWIKDGTDKTKNIIKCIAVAVNKKIYHNTICH